MAQQTAIYDQGRQLMVGAPPSHVRTNGITFLNRMQVRMFAGLYDGRLT